MSQHLSRAILLLNQQRYEQAETELRKHLAEDPNDAVAHAYLAIVLAEVESFEDATTEARLAIHSQPDLPMAHLAMGVVMRERNRLPEAEEALRQAISLDPSDANLYAQLSQTLIERERWQEALDAAEKGLELDPEDTDCMNLRVMLLRRRGRKDEASDTLRSSLATNPSNPYTHANLGWSHLENGNPKEALKSFQEALRLDPELEIARQGIIEALKTRYLAYRLMFRYFTWMSRLDSRVSWGITIGGYVLFRGLKGLARAVPDLAPWIWPILFVYIGFAVVTWITLPLSNLMLRLHPLGRLALSKGERITANIVGLQLLLGICALIAMPWNIGFLIFALTCGLTIPAVSVIHVCDAGWPRWTMIGVAAGLFLIGSASSSLLIMFLQSEDSTSKVLTAIGGLLFGVFTLGALASQFLAGILVSVTVRR